MFPQVSCTTDISLVDELEDVDDGLRDPGRGEEEEGRGTSVCGEGGRRSPGEQGGGSRTVSPLSKLKVVGSSRQVLKKSSTFSFHPLSFLFQPDLKLASSTYLSCFPSLLF